VQTVWRVLSFERSHGTVTTTRVAPHRGVDGVDGVRVGRARASAGARTRARSRARAMWCEGMREGTRMMDDVDTSDAGPAGECARARGPRARTRPRASVEGRGKCVRVRPRREGVRAETYESPVGSPGRFPDEGTEAIMAARRTRRARRGRANGHDLRRQRGRKTTLETREGGAGMSEGRREDAVTPASAGALDRLPRDCLLKVCEFLDITSVEALARTCRTMRETTTDDFLWKRLYESRWRWRPAQTWAKSAKLPFESNFRTEAERPDAYRGGEGWRVAYKERYATRQMKRNSTSQRVVRVVSASDEKSMQARALQRVLNTMTAGDVLELGPGTYDGPLTVPPGVEILGVGKREDILIVSDETPAIRTTSWSHRDDKLFSVVTNITCFRRSATKRGSLSGDGHQACVYISDGSRLRLDSCDVVSAGEGVVAPARNAVAHVHACNIHSFLTSFLTMSESSLSACRITAAMSKDDETDQMEGVPSSFGYDRLFAAVTALSGKVCIANNRIVNGYAHAVVLFDRAYGLISDNLIANNVGAGISVGVSSFADITSSIIANNGSVGIAMCGRGTIRNSEVRGNTFNGIDISQRHGIRGYLPAQFDESDEELDVEEEFSAFLMDLDSEHSDKDNSGEINCVVEGCNIASNANDGICISGGANVDILGCRLTSNAFNLAVERGNVRWSRVFVEGEIFNLSRAAKIRVSSSYSTVQPIPLFLSTPVQCEPNPVSTITLAPWQFVPPSVS